MTSVEASFQQGRQPTLAQKKEARGRNTLTFLSSLPQPSETKSSQKPEERWPRDVVRGISTWKNQEGPQTWRVVLQGGQKVLGIPYSWGHLLLHTKLFNWQCQNTDIFFHFLKVTVIPSLVYQSSLKPQPYYIFFWVKLAHYQANKLKWRLVTRRQWQDAPQTCPPGTGQAWSQYYPKSILRSKNDCEDLFNFLKMDVLSALWFFWPCWRLSPWYSLVLCTHYVTKWKFMIWLTIGRKHKCAWGENWDHCLQ